MNLQMPQMPPKFLFWLLWLGLIVYSFLLAPPDYPDTFDLIQRLSTGQLAGINPLIAALFNLMGVLPLIYSCVLYADGRGQKVRAFPFIFLSFFIGAFGLLPYLALRQANPAFTGPKNWVIRLFDSRWLGLLILLGVIALLSYGISQGDWADFWQQWQTRRFIHVMSLDFCCLCALFPLLVGDDLARRGIQGDRRLWLLAFIPLVGAAAYLVMRPPIQPSATPESDPTPSLS
jgi:hypothetical protein